jgi:hypothetical protein
LTFTQPSEATISVNPLSIDGVPTLSNIDIDRIFQHHDLTDETAESRGQRLATLVSRAIVLELTSVRRLPPGLVAAALRRLGLPHREIQTEHSAATGRETTVCMDQW